MVVCQQDSLRKDSRSEDKVIHPSARCGAGAACTAARIAQRPECQGTRLPSRGVHGAPGGLSRACCALRTFAALHHREFRLLWSGQASTAMAMWMDQVVRGWLMYELTNSPVQLGLVQGVQAIPILVLSPVAGSVADRYPRKLQMVVAQVLAGLMYVVLALLIMTGHIQPWHVYATAFGMAIVQTFHQPARAAMIADAVPPYHLTNAIGLTSIVFNVARSTGPALAGFLIATLGTASCYVVQAGFYLVAIVWTLQLAPGPERCHPAGVGTPRTAPPSARASSKDGRSAGVTRRYAPGSSS